MDKQDQEIYKTTKKQINSLNDVFESDTFIASIYLLHYLNNGNEIYYNLFLEKMEKFSYEERVQVFINVSNNLKEQKNKKDDKKHHKTKTKGSYG